MPTLCPERALEHAARVPAGAPLAGLPIAVKDLNDVAGVRTTYGSPIFADFVPEQSDLMVERLESRGAVVIGKSNSPEFGAGANTFNEVFGETRNPWDVLRTCGGSSGGSAARWPPGRCGWRPAPTWAAACARRPGSAAWSASGRAPGASPEAPASGRSTRCRSRGRWAGRWATPR